MRPKLRGGGGLKISFFAFQDIITSVTGILILVTLILTMYLKPSAESASQSPQSSESTLQSELTQAQEHALALKTELDELRDLPATSQLEKAKEQLLLDTVAVQEQLARLRQNSRPAAQTAQQKAWAQAMHELRAKIAELESKVTATNGILSNAVQSLSETNAVLAKLSQELKQEQANSDVLKLIPGSTSDGKAPVVVVVSAGDVTLQEFRPGAPAKKIGAAALVSNPASAFSSISATNNSLIFFVRPSGIELFRTLRKSAKTAGFAIGYDLIEENKQLELSPGQ